MSDRPNQDAPSPSSPSPADSAFSLHGLSITPEPGGTIGTGAPTQPSHLLPPDTAAFHFLREIGRGGMGVVYEAVDIATARHVAVKIVSPHLLASPQARQRFEAEARLAAAISHPHCVFVFGAHVVGGAPAIAMELMTGRNLDDVVKAGAAAGGAPIPVETAVRWTIELLDGLAAAHHAGVIHRDVKPSNCFLTADDHVKVGDFGLSRSADTDLNLTQSGAFLGTPFYASPEQIRGRPLDHRTDVYSAGATLYTLLAGKPAFAGSNLGDVLARITSEAPPPLSAVRDDLPRGLEKVVARALAKEPGGRFSDAAALRRALLPFAPGRLTNAGLGLRIGAYLIDSILLQLAAAAFLIAAAQVSAAARASIGRLQSDGAAGGALVGKVLTTAAGMLYFVLSEGLTGASLGKRLLRLKVVAVDAPRMTVGRAAVRVLAFEGLRAGAVLGSLGMNGVLAGVIPFAAWAILLCSMRRRNGWRGLHEFLTGTRVVQGVTLAVAPRTAELLDAPRAAPAGMPTQVGRYPVDGYLGPTAAGVVLVGRDLSLDRPVWIHVHAPDAPVPPAPPTVGDAGVRLLERNRSAPHPHDVYEAAGGMSVVEFAATRGVMSWEAALPRLVALGEALGQDAAAPSVEHLWIDRSGRLRVTPFALHGSPATTAPRNALVCAARLMLLPPHAPAGALPLSAPLNADAAITPLFAADGGSGLDAAGLTRALAALPRGPATVSRRQRVVQIAVAALLPAILVGIAVSEVAEVAPTPAAAADNARSTLLALAFAWMVPFLVLAAATRRPPTLATFGMGVRDRTGARASRWLVVVRTLVSFAPAAPVAVGATITLVSGNNQGLVDGALLTALAGIAAVIACVASPTQGPHDRMLRTTIVRR